LFSALKREFPRLHLKALTMVELDFFARFYKMSDEDVIERLKAAGMDSCPGGGAEIFAEPTRSRICDHKCDGARWLELAGKVHQAGLKTNATMLYGHIETTEDRVDHFIKLREQQDRTGGFQCFIPLAFYPPGTALSSLPGPDAITNLKTIAVSRLMLDNFDHIKAYWVMLGLPTTQTALHFGANDVDGTITDGGELTHAYSVEDGGEKKMTKAELIALIENAGFEAVERDTVYNRVERAAV
jgi:aminodeoxyfutalosine synthase